MLSLHCESFRGTSGKEAYNIFVWDDPMVSITYDILRITFNKNRHEATTVRPTAGPHLIWERLIVYISRLHDKPQRAKFNRAVLRSSEVEFTFFLATRRSYAFLFSADRIAFSPTLTRFNCGASVGISLNFECRWKLSLKTQFTSSLALQPHVACFRPALFFFGVTDSVKAYCT